MSEVEALQLISHRGCSQRVPVQHREYTSSIVLGNGKELMGESLSSFKMNKSARIISASEVNGAEPRLEKSLVVEKAGGVGMVMIDEAENDVAIPFAIPAATVRKEIGNKIFSYVNHTRLGAASTKKKPSALIFPVETVLGSRPAPRVAAFSSKGPNLLTAEPDIAAPGLNILAAWSPAVNNMKYNVLSGTSMSCPSVTGLVALIKLCTQLGPHDNRFGYPQASDIQKYFAASVLDRNGGPITADPKRKASKSFRLWVRYPRFFKTAWPMSRAHSNPIKAQFAVSPLEVLDSSLVAFLFLGLFLRSKQGGGCEDHGWVASSVVTGWVVAATVVTTGVRNSKGTGDCGSRGDCPASVTKDVEQGGATVGRQAMVITRWLVAVVGQLGGGGVVLKWSGSSDCGGNRRSQW
ncbi:hypothetical protein C4D60_Mb09t17720 [Musa balbisiana]|uniref:Peptidase S8/S53 domain-containing protein n=1 Tax=Musa balbisiana TaxID=52838 RepID=A0A4S8IH53_MUSBA|nr:hypothetical protein C4D60_Mb09t17720 [Musa balbisiana]